MPECDRSPGRSEESNDHAHPSGRIVRPGRQSIGEDDNYRRSRFESDRLSDPFSHIRTAASEQLDLRCAAHASDRMDLSVTRKHPHLSVSQTDALEQGLDFGQDPPQEVAGHRP